MEETKKGKLLQKDRVVAKKNENDTLAARKFLPQDRAYFLRLKSENADFATCYLYACALGIEFCKESAVKGVDKYLQSNGMKMTDLGANVDICLIRKYSDCVANNVFIHIQGTTKEGVSMSIPLISLDADRGVFITALGKKYSPNFFETLTAKVFYKENIELDNFLQFSGKR